MKWLVIGGGTAGCVVAARLSEDPDNEVVLLEAGVDHGPGPVPDRGGVYLEDADRQVDASLVVRRAGRELERYPQGFGLGGTSLINGCLATPDPIEVHGHLMPLEQAIRLGTLGTAVLDADQRARPAVFTRRDGQRVTVADIYLRPALLRPNLFVVTGSRVVRLGLNGWKVERAITDDGVEYGADRFVVCAGAIGTPTLLLRSGLDTPGIGQGLQDHPACLITVELAPGSDVDAPALTVLLDRVSSQIIPINHLPQAAGYGGLLIGLMAVTSVGQVTLPDPDGPPLVELNELSTAVDRAGIAETAADALALLEQPAIRAVTRRAYLDDHGTPVESLEGDPDRIAAWATAGQSPTLFHLASSCREGVVTDPFGGVLGYEGLYICDASLFPRVPARNPYLPVVQLAERLTAQWRSLR